MAEVAGCPFFPIYSAGIAQDPTSIVGSADDLGKARWCRRSDGGWYVELCAYTSGDLTANLAYRLSASGYASATTMPAVKAIATQDGAADNYNTIVVPQAAVDVSETGYYAWVAIQGFVEHTGGATVSAGQFIETLHDGGGEWIDAGVAQEGADAIPIVAYGVAVDAGADGTASTVFLLGQPAVIAAA